MFQQYIEKNAKDAGARIDLAYALDQLKDTAGAIKELKLALELDSDSPDAQNDLAWTMPPRTIQSYVTPRKL